MKDKYQIIEIFIDGAKANVKGREEKKGERAGLGTGGGIERAILCLGRHLFPKGTNTPSYLDLFGK